MLTSRYKLNPDGTCAHDTEGKEMTDAKTIKQLQANLDAANSETKHLMDLLKHTQAHLAETESNLQMLHWQMNIIKTVLSRVVVTQPSIRVKEMK